MHMALNVPSFARLQVAARRLLMWSAVLSCCACTSIPNFLRPPTPRASVSTAVQAVRAGVGTEHWRSCAPARFAG